MVTEDHLETRVRVLVPNFLGTPEDASLTLRGKTLTMDDIQAHQAVARGDFEAGMAHLHQVSDNRAEEREHMNTQVELARDMES